VLEIGKIDNIELSKTLFQLAHPIKPIAQKL